MVAVLQVLIGHVCVLWRVVLFAMRGMLHGESRASLKKLDEGDKRCMLRILQNLCCQSFGAALHEPSLA